mmetsp:Transcript_17154/g.40035  ORF Transcript_17154/g.40035 Transcript_17154/m.40035 type:complete len:450 (+) Transcript_17154:43-1392(+)
MQNLVTQIQALSQPADWGHLVTTLETDGVLSAAGGVGAVGGILAQLNAQDHTVGFAVLLHFKTSADEAAGNSTGDLETLRQVHDLVMMGGAAALQHVRSRVCEVCKVFALAARRTGRAILGVRVLKNAVEKLRPTPEHLTSVHADFLMLCLAAKLMKPTASILEQRILKISTDCVQPRDMLLYYYYGGMVMAATKQFSKALDLLMLAFTMPCHALTEIVVEAYKKYMLVSMILHGEVQALPKYTGTLVQRLIKTCCTEYNELATALATHKPDEVQKSIDKYRTVLVRDQNLGLANQALASVYKRNIQRLTQTFVTLSLEDIAQEVGLQGAEEAKGQLLAMIGQGQISASIDESKGMVSFDKSADPDTSHVLFKKLSEQIAVAMELNSKLRAVDEAISTNHAYLSKVSSQERQSRWGEPSEWPGGAAAGATSDEMMDVGEKPPGFNSSHA